MGWEVVDTGRAIHGTVRRLGNGHQTVISRGAPNWLMCSIKYRYAPTIHEGGTFVRTDSGEFRIRCKH